MTMTSAHRDYMTVKEAAAELGVSPSTIWRWISAGRIPAQRIGPKIIRLRKRDVDEAGAHPAFAFASTDPWEAIRRSLRPMTEEEGHRLDAALKAAGENRAEMRKERGGKLVPSSTDIIREWRDKR